MNSKLLKIAVISFFFAMFLFSGRARAEGGYADTHIHLDPMALVKRNKASGPRPMRGPARSRSQKSVSYRDLAENIITLMDKMGVEKGVLMPPPQVPFQEGIESTYEIYSAVAGYYPHRLLLGAGGDSLNPLIYQYSADEVTPEVKERFRSEAERLAGLGIAVFGEMSALHLSMQEHHIFAQVEPDHPLFLLLADIAAENNIPIDLHMEAIPEDMPAPESILRISSRNPSTLRANISNLERLLAHNRKAKIVWQHIGWDNVGYMTIGLLRQLLERNPNLYLALRVEYRQMKIDQSGPMPNRIVDKDWNVYPDWVKFILDFSDRIVIGSDDFMGLTRRNPRPKDSFAQTWRIIEQFPEEIRRKIGHKNVLRIYN